MKLQPTEPPGQDYFFFNLNCFLDRERKGGERQGRERERERDWLFHLSMHSLVDSYICPDLVSNPQPWGMGMML